MVQIFKNFLTKEECEKLSEIALKGVEEKWIGPSTNSVIGYILRHVGLFTYKKRLTSRPYMRNKKYPEYVLEISNKVRNFMGIQKYPLILKYKNFQHGSDGIVVSVTYPGGNVTEHCDLRSEDNWVTYRCNIITQAPDSGGILYVDGNPVDISVGDLHCYYPSEHAHYVTDVEGETPRILWMFGAHRPYEDFLEQQNSV
jgi:hypothetical protein